MARKFGKRNVVKIDPLAYNMGLFGESGIGKSTIVSEICDKLAGEDGSLILNIFRESGIDAIQGAVYEDVESWSKYYEIIDDIVENKDTDYKDLKVVVLDTVDELSILAEKEVIRLHNKKNPKKKTDTLNAAFGGFGVGGKMVSELILKSIDDLKSVGINVFLVGHTKRRTKLDPISGEEFDVITAKITDRLFVDLKTKMDVLGLGVVKRNIEKDIIGKDIMGKDRIQNNVKSQNRVITFRDDNYTIEAKSRFADIINEIPFDSDEFIKAIREAIQKAYDKKPIGKTIKQAEKDQKKEKETKVNSALEDNKKQKELKAFGTKEEVIEKIKDGFNSLEDKTPVIEAMKKIDCKNFDILSEESMENIISIYNLIK